ncbi:unnamed protein product [Rotaria socialis]
MRNRELHIQELKGQLENARIQPKAINKNFDLQFALPDSYKTLRCKGRCCAYCGQCRYHNTFFIVTRIHI